MDQRSLKQNLMVVLRLMNLLRVLIYIYTMYPQLKQHRLGSKLTHQLCHRCLVFSKDLSMRDRLQVFATGMVHLYLDRRLYPCPDLY